MLLIPGSNRLCKDRTQPGQWRFLTLAGDMCKDVAPFQAPMHL